VFKHYASLKLNELLSNSRSSHWHAHILTKSQKVLADSNFQRGNIETQIWL